MAMRVDRVVQLGSYRPALDPQARFDLGVYAMLNWVFLGIQSGTTTQPRLRSHRANILHDPLVADQRLARPVLADRAKQPMPDRVPLPRPWRVMRHRHCQPEFVRAAAQPPPPPPIPAHR